MNRFLSRRLFLGASAIAGVSRAQAATKSLAPARLGAELYTVRSQMPAKDEEVLRTIAKIGYREIEGDYPTFMRISSMAKSLGLQATSCHIPTESVVGGADSKTPLEKILTDLKGIGTEYAVVPYLDEKLRTKEFFDQFGEKMNRAGELAQKMGLQLAYHNHAFEWADMDGKRVFDRMFSNTDPKLVKFEADVFWLTTGGIDPVRFLNQQGERVVLLHLKDQAPSSKVQYNERLPHEAFKEVGNGKINFPAILKAAEKNGIKHYFVEQDWTPGDPLDSLKQSFNYINALRA